MTISISNNQKTTENRVYALERKVEELTRLIYALMNEPDGNLPINKTIMEVYSAEDEQTTAGYGKLSDIFATDIHLNEEENIRDGALRIKLGMNQEEGGAGCIGRDRNPYDLGLVECMMTNGRKVAVSVWGY